MREAKLLAQLHHPNIASIFGLEESDGTRALVMELVEGPTLAERLEHGALPFNECLSVSLQIAQALEEAHEKGIVHRDLKPQNIKASMEGKVKVLDFGLAKAVDPMGAASGGASASQLAASPTLTLGATQMGVILGTAAYMAPEQAKGFPVDKRADIWAFGVVVWEMLLGRQMYAGETVQETLGLVMLREPDLGALPAGTPGRLRDLLARCLDRDPKRRLRDIGEARLALERIVAGDLGDAKQATVSPSSVRWLPILGSVAAAAILAFAIARSLAPASKPAPLRRLDLVADGVAFDWFTGPTLSPDGSKIAYSGQSGIWVRDLGELAARQVATVDQPSPLFWSPDGESLGYASSRKLWRVAADGRNNVAICDLPETGWAISGAWRQDGRIAFSAWRGAIYTVPAAGGRPALLFDHDSQREIDYHFLSWLPDGRLLFQAHGNQGFRPSTGKSSAAPGSSPFGDMELGTFDGKQRRPVDSASGGEIEWPIFDPVSRLLLSTHADPDSGIWARPVDPESLAPAGEAFLLAPEARTLSLAADGSLIYLEATKGEGLQELVWVDRTGRVLSIVAPAQNGLTGPALSAEGSRIVVTAKGDSTHDVWIVDVARGTSSRLTFESSAATAPRWDATSRRVVYTELHHMESAIVSRAADGSGERRELFHGGAVSDPIAQPSPDGSELLLGTDDRGATRLRIARVESDGLLGDRRPFFAAGLDPNVREVRISPDGTLLAYVTDDSGQPEIFLTRFPSGEGRWQVSREGGQFPRWAARTGELVYIGGAGPGTRVMTTVGVEATPDVIVGSPTPLFRFAGAEGLLADRDGFDVIADGSRFLMVRRIAVGGSAAQRMILVQNWRQALSARPR